MSNLTNFAALTDEEKTSWSREFWGMARNLSFINQFAGKSHNSMVHRITELTKNEKGARAVLTLVKDLVGDGVAGDSMLEGYEEPMDADDQVIRIDQLRNGNRIEGRMADQKSIVNFREQSRDKLAYWISDRLDQMAFLALAGVPFTHTNKGAQRYSVDPGAGRKLTDLDFAADVTAPSTNRHRRWNGATKSLVPGNVATMAAGDNISYAALVEAKAFAKDQYIRGVRSGAGEEVYHCFVPPLGMAKLKLDPDYLANVRNAWTRGGKNPLFAGTTAVMVDGLVIHEFRHVYNTMNAISGASGNAGAPFYKWGADANLDGYRVSMCGAQALGFADLGNAYWEEDEFDYKNQLGISIGKIIGFKKPVFESIYTGAAEDFGVLNIDFVFAPAT